MDRGTRRTPLGQPGEEGTPPSATLRQRCPISPHSPAPGPWPSRARHVGCYKGERLASSQSP